MIMTSCTVSPEHLTACRLIALIACASNPSLNFCMLGNFHAFVGVYRLFFFFKIIFFSAGPDQGQNCLHMLSAEDSKCRL